MEQKNENPSAVGKTKPHSPESPKRNRTNLSSELTSKVVGNRHIWNQNMNVSLTLPWFYLVDFQGKGTVIYFAE